MKKHVAEIFVTLLVGAMAVGLQNSKTWVANSGTDQAKSGTVERLLMQMERDWGKAIVDRNIAKIREIVAADVVLTTPDGTVQSLDDDLAELKSGAFTAELYDSLDMEVKLYGDCAAVLTGKTSLKGKYKGEDVQDQFRWTDTFVRRKSRWQIVASQATLLPKADPK
jgi:ketosteroid isomerase-like protein